MASSVRLHRRVRLALLFALVSAAGALPGAASAQTPTWTGGGPPGGNVYAVAADPSHAGTLYAATQRGVFKSADGGASWVFSGTGLLPARVQALAVDPTNPSTLFAGTLTPNGVASVGIFKSTDAGATWRDANLGLVDPVTGAGPVDIESLAVNPRDSNVVLAGGLFSEIYRSGDGGTTWQAVTFGGFSLGLQTSAIVFDPATPANVYAASNLGFLRSADGGFTWSTFGNAGVPFFTLAIDPTQPLTLYAGDANSSGIWKSTDGGSHWATANVSLPGSAGSRPPVIALAVDPAHSSTVYAGTYGSGVWVSANAGASWAAAANGMRDTRVASLTVAPAQSSTVYAGTYGGGVYESVDGAQSWVKANNGLNAAVVSAVLVDPSASGVVYAATSDGVSVSSDAGGDWRDSGSGLPPVTVPALALVGGGSPRLLAGTRGSGLYQSSDHGSTWTSAESGLNDSYISSLAIDPSSPTTLYAGTAHPFTGSNSERVFKSTDGGATWTQTSLDVGAVLGRFHRRQPGSRWPGSRGKPGGQRALPQPRRRSHVVDRLHNDRLRRTRRRDVRPVRIDHLSGGHGRRLPQRRRREHLVARERRRSSGRVDPRRSRETGDAVCGHVGRSRDRRRRRGLCEHRRGPELRRSGDGNPAERGRHPRGRSGDPRRLCRDGRRRRRGSLPRAGPGVARAAAGHPARSPPDRPPLTIVRGPSPFASGTSMTRSDGTRPCFSPEAPRLLLAASGSREHVRAGRAVVSCESANAHKLLKWAFRDKLLLEPDPKQCACDSSRRTASGPTITTSRHDDMRKLAARSFPSRAAASVPGARADLLEACSGKSSRHFVDGNTPFSRAPGFETRLHRTACWSGDSLNPS